MIYCPYGNIVNFYTRVEYVSPFRMNSKRHSSQWTFPLGCGPITTQTAARSVHALSHKYATNSNRLQWDIPHPPPKISHCGRAIAKPNYVPDPWTKPTHHLKQRPDLISRFSTIHRTDRQTDRPTD